MPQSIADNGYHPGRCAYLIRSKADIKANQKDPNAHDTGAYNLELTTAGVRYAYEMRMPGEQLPTTANCTSLLTNMELQETARHVAGADKPLA